MVVSGYSRPGGPSANAVARFLVLRRNSGNGAGAFVLASDEASLLGFGIAETLRTRSGAPFR